MRDAPPDGATTASPQPQPGGSTPSWIVWSRQWETAVRPAEHEAIALLLGRAFPGSASGRSWIGARPELRLVGREGDRPVAHAGIVRRFLRAPDDGRSVLVGDVGLVAVDPASQGRQLGGALMSEVAAVLADLDLPYGFLTCSAEVAPFYRRQGWLAADQPLHAIDVHHRVEAGHDNGMLLPVTSPSSGWPRGRLIRDGQEI